MKPTRSARAHPPPLSSDPPRASVWGFSLGLAILTLAVYAQVRTHAFLQFDDAAYVTENGAVRAGLTWAGARWAFSTPYAGNWHPLTWLTHMADVELFGLEAGRHLLVNVLLHAAASVLLLRVLVRATGAVGPSAFVAGLFALHPLHVESVAWVAERKDVLSTFWWVLAVGAYVSYARRPGWRRMAVVVALFGLALLSKPMVVTFPFVLLLLDAWPLGRWTRTSRPDAVAGAGADARPMAALVREKWPLFLMAAAAGTATFFAQRQAGAVQTLDAFPLALRLANIPVAYVTYVGQAFWPTGLAPLYPYPETIPLWQSVGAALLLAAVSAAVLRAAGSRPYLAVGWLWFLGTLVPVIGLVQVGAQPHADRYTYVPTIGLFIAVAWGVADLLSSRPGWRRAAVAAGTGAGLLASAVTFRQVAHWRDSVTLWQHTVSVTRDNYRAHTNLGFALADTRAFTPAVEEYREALRLKPGFAQAHNYLGVTLAERGDHAQAETEFRAALRSRPRFVEAHNNLGLTLAALGRLDEAVAAFREALRLDPAFVPARTNLGTALAQQGQFDRAIEEWTAVLQVQPERPEIQLNLAMALASASRPADALPHFEAAARLGGDPAQTNYAWGVTLADLGRLDDALEKLAAALRANPSFVPAIYETGLVFERKGLRAEAAQAMEAVLRLNPSHTEARDVLRRLRGK